jgi:hypothetical protein
MVSLMSVGLAISILKLSVTRRFFVPAVYCVTTPVAHVSRVTVFVARQMSMKIGTLTSCTLLYLCSKLHSIMFQKAVILISL